MSTWDRLNQVLTIKPNRKQPLGFVARELVVELLSRGREIDAVKFYREETRAGLREAVSAVERLRAERVAS
jgi:hypothetical protein